MSHEAQTFSFRLLLHGPDVTEGPTVDRLYEAGCDDALFGKQDHVQYAGFDRKAPRLAEAVLTAILQIESVPQMRVLRVEPDELVSATAIATRTKRSRESVRLLIEGKRGPGHFPAPLSWVDAKKRLWRWSDVARWFADELGDESVVTADADALAAINAALETRHRLQGLDTNLRDRLAQLAGLAPTR